MEFESGNIEGRTILVVEDSDDMWWLTQKALSRAGAFAERAVNGLEAVEKASHHSYAAILMDVQMPVMDGLEATRVLRARGFLSPIIALTTNTFREHSAESIEAGCNEHVTKPVSAHSLIAKLANYCDGVDVEMTLGLA